MKRLRFIPALLLILSACSENIIEQGRDDSAVEGSVSIALTTDMRTEDATTKAGEELPDVDDFRVAIYKLPRLVRLYNDSYANTAGKEIKLNAGEYRLVAQYGDSTGCGFNKPYYMADPNFRVEGPGARVQATAKLSNVKLAVKYDASIADNQETYPDYYTVVKRKVNGTDRISKELKVKFGKTETRNGYIPAGDLALEVWAKIDGVWKCYETQPVSYEPNAFVTFTVSTDASQGNLTISIKVDTTVENKDYTVEIPAIAVPQPAPGITLAGFDGADNSHAFVEGVNAGANAMASFIAKGSLAHCYLTIESEYLAARGIPESLDFANLTADQRTALNAAGFGWNADMATSRKLSYIDFSGVISKMLAVTKAAAQDETIARFTLRVEDSVAKSTEETFSIVSAAVDQTVSVADYNVWAKRIKNPVITAGNGNMSLFKLQYSSDRKVWTDMPGTPVKNGNTLTYGVYEGTDPGTSYYFRSVYNNNENSVSPVLEVRTEEAAQLPNRGFEDWTDKTFSDGSRGSIAWYQPWGGATNAFWAVNSPAAFNVTYTSPGTFGAEVYHRMSPLAVFSTDNHTSGGNKSAHIFNVQLGNYVTNTTIATSSKTYVGEMFIGTASETDGTHIKDGQPFACRPSKVEFWYKYVPWKNENFVVKAEIIAADGTVIASKEITDGPGASEWTKYTLPLEYTVMHKTAASIFISFKTSFSTTNIDNEKDLELGGQYINAYFGSSLRIDDMELIYE